MKDRTRNVRRRRAPPSRDDYGECPACERAGLAPTTWICPDCTDSGLSWCVGEAACRESKGGWTGGDLLVCDFCGSNVEAKCDEGRVRFEVVEV